MAIEIERKFLLYKNWAEVVKPNHFIVTETQLITQAYITNDPERVVRVRVVSEYRNNATTVQDQACFLTIKGKKVGMSAREMEYAVPLTDATALLALCLPRSVIKKTRFKGYEFGSELTWEVDVFADRHEGLIVAEIELPSETTAIPQGMLVAVQKEVTTDHRYSNMNMAFAEKRNWDLSV